jgi:hypothetical protein
MRDIREIKRPWEKGTFSISRAEAARIIDGLELSASWDKTKIYYELKRWLDDGDDE